MASKQSKTVGLAAVAALFAILVVTPAGPDPQTCEGYPERRVFIENQSWVTPQPGPVAHPGTGKQGHIHVSMCFPLHQTITADILSLDIRVQLHNVPGTVTMFRTVAYQMGQPVVFATVPSCPNIDCDTWVHVDLPVGDLPVSGWGNIWSGLFVKMSNGETWYNVNRWFLNVQNGQPVRPDQPSFGGTPKIWIGGDTWLPSQGTPTNYSPASIKVEDFPWNFATGELIPISGMWKPNVVFGNAGPASVLAASTGQAMIDPKLHAVPVDYGVMVYDGAAGARQLSIDTTQLSNGKHRLLLAACHQRTGTENCGVLVVTFLVAN